MILILEQVVNRFLKPTALNPESLQKLSFLCFLRIYMHVPKNRFVTNAGNLERGCGVVQLQGLQFL